MTRQDEVSEQVRKIVAEIVDGAIHETVFIDDVKDMMTECLVAVIADRAAERLGGSHLTGDSKVVAERDNARRRVLELEATVERMGPVVTAAERLLGQLDPVVKVYRERLTGAIAGRNAELGAAVERMGPVVAAVERWFNQEGDRIGRALQTIQQCRDKLRGPR